MATRSAFSNSITQRFAWFRTDPNSNPEPSDVLVSLCFRKNLWGWLFGCWGGCVGVCGAGDEVSSAQSVFCGCLEKRHLYRMDAVKWRCGALPHAPALERGPLDPVLANRASFFKPATLSLGCSRTRLLLATAQLLFIQKKGIWDGESGFGIMEKSG